MENKVFGVMSFNYGWTKQEVLSFWGKNKILKIRISAYPEDLPTEKQEKAYLSFKSNLEKVSEESLVRLAMFLMTIPEANMPSSLEKAIDQQLHHEVNIEEILFFKDGSYAIECEVDWTDMGVAILIEGTKMVVGYSDDLLGCRI